MPARNPRKHPKPGDTVLKNGSTRHVIRTAKNERGTLISVYFNHTGLEEDSTTRATISAWRAWCNDDCKVIWTAEQEQDPADATAERTALVLAIENEADGTPIAHLKPTRMEGITVTQATLHSQDERKRKDVRIGDTVIIRGTNNERPEVVRVVPEHRPMESEARQ